MQKSQENFFGWFQPVQKETKYNTRIHNTTGCPCGGTDPLCDVCFRLRKIVDKVQIQPVPNQDDFNHQFDNPLAGWSDEMKDLAMNNNGSLKGKEKCDALGNMFHGKLLPHSKPHGAEYHTFKDSCFKAGPPNGVRFVNAYRESTDNCEAVCGYDVCKEYGNALERYANCMDEHRKLPLTKRQDVCGPQPKNPKDNGCERCGPRGPIPPEYAQNSWKRWMPDMTCRTGYK